MIIVTIQYDPVWRAAFWAKENCSSFIKSTDHLDENWYTDKRRIDYIFNDNEDALAFKLRWG